MKELKDLAIEDDDNFNNGDKMIRMINTNLNSSRFWGQGETD